MKILAEGITALNLEVSENVQQTMLQFVGLLQKWNKAYNLTAKTSTEEIIKRHILDSLSIAPFLQEGKTLDVGTGAGFPGIPLALYYPDHEFVLLDGNGKKIRFITQVINELGLTNVIALQSRAEDFQDVDGFSNITLRAFGSVRDIIAKTRHLLAKNGQWLLMKGVLPESELAEIDYPHTVESLKVQGLNEERHLIIMRKNQDD